MRRQVKACPNSPREPLGSRRRGLARRIAGGAALLLAVAATPADAVTHTAAHSNCARLDRLRVPGAAHQQADCLAELTTAGTVDSGHTDPADWAGLTPKDLSTPSGVPGIQIDGYFPDTSKTNTRHGWNHDAQFVIRLPDHWNGGLVVAGTPGNRAQYANDRAIADWALARGYAYAATDKGNTGPQFHRDGRRPSPRRTLATGMSNGGYVVRWQLENHPELYDGGVDWEGTLWRADGPNPLTSLPTALRSYPTYAAGDDAEAARAHQEMIAAGFPAGSEFLWPYHHRTYWDLTQRIYREEFDPGYDGPAEAGTPYCAPGTPACDADYDYAARPARVHRAVERISLTGKIGKPLITVQGTLDVLLPISRDADVYARMVQDAGRDGLFRSYRVEGATHTDSLFDTFPDRLRPLLPCHRSAFTALEDWLRAGHRPPPSHTIPRPEGADPATLLTSCPLAG